MGIVDEDVARVRQATDFVAVAGEHIALKKVGRRFVGLCPFHAEKSPSFSVNAEEGLYYCFGCQAKGDVITFVREVEHLDFVEAVERLAAKAGIQLRYDSEATSREHKRRGRLVEAMGQAVDWYHERLLSAPDAARARGYLRSRGYDGEVVRRFKIGWAPDDWDALVRSLDLPADVLRDTGLGFVNRRDRLQDSFRGRVMFPIFDVRGDPVAFGGRALDSDAGPKYKNSPETPLYAKSKVLYGLNWAKAGVVEAGEVVVCEGYTDVIGFFLAGLPRAVATCGTALADEHFRTLKNFARRVVLAYDADAAGQAAAERFYEWERRYEVDIAVAALPPGTDPADVARTDPDALRAAVEGARPFLAFRIDRALGRVSERSTPEARAKAAEVAVEAIREHPNEIVRERYAGQVAARLNLPVKVMAQSVEQPRRAPVRIAPPVRRVEGPEVELLKLAIHRPDAVAGRVHEVMFADELHLSAFRALSEVPDLHAAIASSEPAVAELLQRLAVDEPPDSDPDDVVALVARQTAERTEQELLAETRGAAHPEEYADVLRWLRGVVEDLQGEPSAAVEVVPQLLAWLVDRGEDRAG